MFWLRRFLRWVFTGLALWGLWVYSFRHDHYGVIGFWLIIAVTVLVELCSFIVMLWLRELQQLVADMQRRL